MLNAREDRAALVASLRKFAEGGCPFDLVEECAYDIRDRWAEVVPDARPAESDTELALWAAVWEITGACRESLLDQSGGRHPVLQHIAYLEGTEAVPKVWSARRP